MNARLLIWVSAIMAYVLGLFAILFVCLAAWSAWAGEPGAIPPSTGTEAAAYATGAGALGGVAGFGWLIKLVAGFFGDLIAKMDKGVAALEKAVLLLEKHDRRIEIEEAAEAKFRDTGPINIPIGVPR